MEGLERAVKKAAATVAWQWRDFIEADDLEQELWVWYLESGSVQAKLDSNTPEETHGLLVRQAHRIASETRRKYGQSVMDYEYSIDDARGALDGTDTRDFVQDDLEYALDELRDKNSEQSVLIREKFVHGLSMGSAARRQMLMRAVESVADLMNQSHRDKAYGYMEFEGCTLGDGPGTRKVVSNATANSALGTYS